MGEYADDAIDYAMAQGCAWDMRRPHHKPWKKTCKTCGETDLRWDHAPGGVGWRLHTQDGVLHICPPAIERVRRG